MVKIVFIILIMMACNSCSKTRQIEGELVSLSENRGHIYISSTLDSILDVYIKENSFKKSYNEIYVDKQLPDYTILTIRSVPEIHLRLQEKQPLFYINKADNLFFIYSGLEKYFHVSNYCQDCMGLLNPTDTSVYWYVVDSFNILTINRDFSFPFFPLPEKPLIKFDTIR